MITTAKLPKPPWLKVKLPGGAKYNFIKSKSEKLNLATVCQEARCPNIGECWSSGTATFMIMGDVCTRGCRFCSVKTAKRPASLDNAEPKNLAKTLAELDLNYVVITTVDRDDLADQGADHISKCIHSTQHLNPDLLIEVLIPDFRGNHQLLEKVCQAKPAVIAHNIETVDRLTKKVRDRRAGYWQSIKVLEYVKLTHPGIYTKSSIMLGLGESSLEVIQAMEDLRKVKVDFLTLGQYLKPRAGLLDVVEYIHPDKFDFYKTQGLKMGFKYVASGPLVRSSYRAGEFFISSIIKNLKY